MDKKIIMLMVIFLLFPLILKAAAPRVSGNIEQGSRYAVPYDKFGTLTPWMELKDENEQETWAYNYNKGYLQVAQRLTPGFRYTARFSWNWRDYPYAEPELNNKNVMRYYRTFCWITLSDDFDMRLEYYLRQQVYEVRPWNNLIHVPNLRLRWNIDRQSRRRANLFLRLNSQRYADEGEIWKNRDQFTARVNYQQEVYEKLLIKAQYSYALRKYTDNPDESTALKKSASAGFEYQF